MRAAFAEQGFREPAGLMLKFELEHFSFQAMAAQGNNSIKNDQMLNESNSSRRSLLRSESSFTLALLGWLIIGSTLNGMIFNSLPIKLTMPEWQLSLIGLLLSSSFPLLVGISLIVFAQFLNLNDQTLQRWKLLAARFAALFAVLLVLIIPLQFFLGQRILKQQATSTDETVNNLQEIARRISDLNSEEQLRVYVGSLPNPISLPAKFDAAFPVIKNRAIENIKAQINAINNNAQLQKTEALQTFLKEAIRNAAHAILTATAFSIVDSVAGGSGNKVTRFLAARL
jgi:hypothetical protein